MKHIVGLLAMLLPLLSGAQSAPGKSFSIDDAVPDITITNVYNYPASTIHLSDLKGKLVILDFWSTWCSACIEALPKMHQLQKEFGNQLQVVLVNTYAGDSIQRVRPFFEKRKARTGQEITLPYSLLQAPLKEYFPYKFIPHYVWIDQHGKVIATTSQIEVTHDKIRSAISGELGSIHTKFDQLNFDKSKPLLVNGNGGRENEFLYRSIFTNYLEGLGNASGMQRDKNEKITRFYMYNGSPLMMLRIAYPDLLNHIPTYRIIIEATDSNRFKPGATSGAALYKNSFCYELIIPPSTIKDFRQYMKEDTYRYLRVVVKGEKRKVKCLVLKRGENLNRLTSKEGKETVAISKDNINKYIQNATLNTLVEFLNQLPLFNDIRLIDETGFSKRIDITLPSEIYDQNLASIKEFLKKSGFEIKEEMRELEVAVITDKDK